MTAKDSICSVLDMSDMIIDSYVADLADPDLLVRPVPGMNHIAWQLGHLISAEKHFVELVAPGSCPALPEGFESHHGTKDNAAQSDDPKRFLTLPEYQGLWKAQRTATRAVLEKLSDADLDRTDSTFPQFAPTVGSLLNMAGVHAMMHAGQFVAVRRLLNKPVKI